MAMGIYYHTVITLAISANVIISSTCMAQVTPTLPVVGLSINSPNLLQSAEALRLGKNVSVGNISNGTSVLDAIDAVSLQAQFLSPWSKLNALNKKLSETFIGGNLGSGCIFVGQRSDGQSEQYLRIENLNLGCKP